MSNDAAFLRALLAEPADHGVRQVYADWLEERGDLRSRFLRAELALAAAADGAGQDELQAASMGLDPEWLALVSRVNWLDCRPQSARAATVGGEIVRLADSEGVIFPEGYGWTHDDSLFPYWTPTRAVVVAAEMQVRRFLSDRPLDTADEYLRQMHGYHASPILAKLPQYKRQYSGIVHDARPALYIYFTADSWWGDWAITPFNVCDGGDRYFQLIYRPEERDVVQFWVNGEA